VISDLMLYGLKVAVLIGLAGLAFERVAAWRGLPRRGLWAAALVLSVALPALAVLTPKQAMAPPALLTTPVPSSAAAPNAMAEVFPAPGAAPSIAIRSLPRPRHRTWPTRESFEQLLQTVWLAASVGMVTFYVLLWLRLRMAARDWRRERINDQEVWVTEALGPAVFGFVNPIILMPRWTLDAPINARTVVLKHEQEHIAAHDPGLLLLGLLLVAIAPWNVPLWWQLRRLRFAIEVDCDARVLGRGADAIAYSEVLLTIGQRRTFTPVGAIALTEPASRLLRRIQIMTTDVPKRGKWLIGAAIGLSLACVAVAVELQAPRLSAIPAPKAISAGALRKPPLAEDPRIAIVQNVVRTTYPELFGASAAPNPVLVTLLMNQDGTLYKGVKEDLEPMHYIKTSVRAFDTLGVGYDFRRDAGVKLRMPGSPATRNYVDVRAWFLGAIPDPTRDVALVRNKVKERYESLLSESSHDSPKMLTVFMT
jgi:beta-lactamase regulating signal transducer with metallopeptidase domain